MSQSIVVPPVHDTSPPPFDDDVDDNEFVPTMSNDDYLQASTPPTAIVDVLNNSNDDWKSVDENNDTDIAQVEEDNDRIEANVENKEDVVVVVVEAKDNDDGWANFASIGNKIDEISEIPSANEENNNNWADFESSSFSFAQTTNEIIEAEKTINDDFGEFNEIPVVTTSAPPQEKENNNNNDDDDDDFGDFNQIQTTTEIVESEPAKIQAEDDDFGEFSEIQTTTEIVESESAKIQDEDDDFGEFSEVQTAPPPSQTSSTPTNTLSFEQIESLISTCFPVESTSSSTADDAFLTTELPYFTTYKHPTKQISYLESSLSLWKILSNLSNDPTGIQFQWRKSNTEKLFHQALGVSERLRTKNTPLTPEILQPEKVKSNISSTNELENLSEETKTSSDSNRPHFDWKKSGLQNPLADNDSSSLSSNMSKNEEIGFDANKTLDLDFYVPTTTTKSPNESEQITNESPIISSQRSSIPIKTTELSPNSTTTLNDDAKRIIDSLPNFSFMSAKALMFPVRFNANNNEESTSLY